MQGSAPQQPDPAEGCRWRLERAPDAAVLKVCSDYLPVLADSRPDYAALLHQHQRILCRRALLQGAAAVGYKHPLGKKGLEGRSTTATVAGGEDGAAAVSSWRFDRRDAAQQAWLSKNLLPRGRSVHDLCGGG